MPNATPTIPELEVGDHLRVLRAGVGHRHTQVGDIVRIVSMESLTTMAGWACMTTTTALNRPVGGFGNQWGFLISRISEGVLEILPRDFVIPPAPTPPPVEIDVLQNARIGDQVRFNLICVEGAEVPHVGYEVTVTRLEESYGRISYIYTDQGDIDRRSDVWSFHRRSFDEGHLTLIPFDPFRPKLPVLGRRGIKALPLP